MNEQHGDSADSCTACSTETSSGRREFLLDALRAGATALAMIGIASDSASAMPLRWISSEAALGQTRSYPMPAADGVQIDKDNEVILSRSGKAVYAFALSCPHQNTALKWDAAADRFQCPKHKSRYRADGTFIEGRATRSMDRYAVKLVGSSITVDLDTVYQEDTEKAAWTAAYVPAGPC